MLNAEGNNAWAPVRPAPGSVSQCRQSSAGMFLQTGGGNTRTEDRFMEPVREG